MARKKNNAFQLISGINPLYRIMQVSTEKEALTITDCINPLYRIMQVNAGFNAIRIPVTYQSLI